MYDNAKGMPTPHDTAPLDTTPIIHSIPDLDSETATGYSDDTTLKRI